MLVISNAQTHIMEKIMSTEKVVENVSRTDEVLAKVLEKALAVAEKTGNFVVEQAPDVVQQLIVYNTVINVFWTLLGVLLLFLSPYLVGRSFKFHRDSRNYDLNSVTRGEAAVKSGITAGGAVLSAFMGGIFFIANFSDTMKLLFAPKVWLLEYAATLIK